MAPVTGLIRVQPAKGSTNHNRLSAQARVALRSGRWTGLLWTGLLWTGLLWAGLLWAGLLWAGLLWAGLLWAGLQELATDMHPERSYRHDDAGQRPQLRGQTRPGRDAPGRADATGSSGRWQPTRPELDVAAAPDS